MRPTIHLRIDTAFGEDIERFANVKWKAVQHGWLAKPQVFEDGPSGERFLRTEFHTDGNPRSIDRLADMVDRLGHGVVQFTY